MKKLFLMVALAGIVFAGYSSTASKTVTVPVQEAVVSDSENDAALINNWATLYFNGIKWVISTPYPVASDITVIVDGPSTPAVGYALTKGMSYFEINYPDTPELVTIAGVYPHSDGTYVYFGSPSGW